jgi:RNA polymerase sigma-70 factor, ECF subfamily
MNRADAASEFQNSDALAVLSDEHLVAAARDGMHSAFVELCRRHSKIVLRTITRITRNREDAEDALQDSVLRAFTHLNTFDGRSAFSTWFTRIGINSALMLLRKRRTHREIYFDDTTWSVFPMIDSSPDPEHAYFERRRNAAVKEAVRSLPVLLRGVTEARYCEQMSVKDVAACMDISVVATKSRLLRAKKALQRALSEDYAMHSSTDRNNSQIGT